jgi:hypothetical protein
MGYITKSKKERPTGNCASCGKSFVIPVGVTKKKFCDVKCSGKMHEKRHGSDTKIPCLKCHASLLMTGAQSGRLLNWPKQRVSKLRLKLGLKTLSHKEARIKASDGVREYKYHINPDEPWWGNKGAEKLWMGQLKVKDFDWGSIATNEINKKRGREYQSMMHHTSPKNSNFRLKKIARCRIYNAIKRLSNVDKPRIRYRTEKMIGCKVEELATHLEYKFKRGMNWDNHGKWHIDHIIPCASFDLTDEKQMMQCFHYTNLQPLWAEDNLSKSDNIINGQMSLLI